MRTPPDGTELQTVGGQIDQLKLPDGTEIHNNKNIDSYASSHR